LKESTFRDLNPHIRGSYIPSGVYVYIPEKSNFKTLPERSIEPTRVKSKVRVVKKKDKVKRKPKPKPVLKSARIKTKKSKPHGKKVVAKKTVKEKTIVKRERRTQVKTIVVKKEPVVRQKSGERIIIKLSGDPLKNTKVLRLENGAVVYIKD